jgi:hypothetical protein
MITKLSVKAGFSVPTHPFDHRSVAVFGVPTNNSQQLHTPLASPLGPTKVDQTSTFAEIRGALPPEIVCFAISPLKWRVFKHPAAYYKALVNSVILKVRLQRCSSVSLCRQRLRSGVGK